MSPRLEADVLYTSDLHGHEPLYREALEAARQHRVRAIVLGGDLAPHADPPQQATFYRSFLLPLLREYFAEPGSADVAYIFGNDDWKTSEPDDHPRGERDDRDDGPDNRDDDDDEGHDDDDEMDRAERYGWGV